MQNHLDNLISGEIYVFTRNTWIALCLPVVARYDEREVCLKGTPFYFIRQIIDESKYERRFLTSSFVEIMIFGKLGIYEILSNDALQTACLLKDYLKKE